MNIGENLRSVEERIARAVQKSGRTRGDITFIAVTKTHGADMINEAIDLGVTDIGENKPQEIRDKYGLVKPVKWHLIGHLQTNKIKYVIDKVCLIHSVDSVKLMEEIDRQAKKHDLTMDILIQINIADEETKSGIKPEELDTMLDYAKNLKNIRVLGLMAIAPKTDNPDDNIPYFDKMRQLFIDRKQNMCDNVIMQYLSMGMSGDFETAIEHGANMVRVGSAVFGARDYSK